MKKYIVMISFIFCMGCSESPYINYSMLKDDFNHAEDYATNINEDTKTKQEVRDVNHLLQLSEFQPENIYQIKVQEKLTKLDNRQIKEWAAIVGGDVMKVWKFKLTVTAKDAVSQGLKGKDIGDYIKDKEKELFLNK